MTDKVTNGNRRLTMLAHARELVALLESPDLTDWALPRDAAKVRGGGHRAAKGG